MKKTLLLCLFALMSLTNVAWSQASKPALSAEQTVAALEQQWLKSQQTNNPELLAPLLAEKFISTDPDGKVVGKAETMVMARATKWTSIVYGDLKVSIFGNTAISTLSLKGKGTDDKGQPMDDYSRWTDTWVKMPSGQWLCVASHGSNIKK